MGPLGRKTDLFVGVFVLGGLILAASLIWYFSRSGQKFRGGYELVVSTVDASGVRSGVPVRMGGLDIGYVSGDPQWTDNFRKVEIRILIHPDSKIPSGSTVQLATSGLMGDTYLRLVPPKNPSDGFLESGESMTAEPVSSLTDLTQTAGTALLTVEEAIDGLTKTLDGVDRVFQKLETDVLSAQNVQHIEEMLASLKTSASHVETATEKLSPLLTEAENTMTRFQGAADSAELSFQKLGKGADALEGVIVSIGPVVDRLDGSFIELEGALGQVRKTVEKINQGPGIASVLINDKEFKDDIVSFVDKLDRRGLLFYPVERKQSKTTGEGAPPRKPFKRGGRP